MITKLNKRRYTLPDRLSDVIRLITVLSIDKYAFRKIDSLKDALRGEPLSLKTWEEIAYAHPEFFRPNGAEDYIALLIRSYRPENHENQRDPLSIPETQKLIDVAISLHEKEIDRIQRNSHMVPIIVAFITLLGIFISTYVSNSDIKQKIEVLSGKIQKLEIKLDNYNGLKTQKSPTLKQ
jgi:hypothetical protein